MSVCSEGQSFQVYAARQKVVCMGNVWSRVQLQSMHMHAGKSAHTLSRAHLDLQGERELGERREVEYLKRLGNLEGLFNDHAGGDDRECPDVSP